MNLEEFEVKIPDLIPAAGLRLALALVAKPASYIIRQTDLVSDHLRRSRTKKLPTSPSISDETPRQRRGPALPEAGPAVSVKVEASESNVSCRPSETGINRPKHTIAMSQIRAVEVR
jgi:hypothetical protein